MHYKLSAEIQGDKKSLARGNMKKKMKKQKKKRVVRKNRKSGVPKGKQAPDMVSLARVDSVLLRYKRMVGRKYRRHVCILLKRELR
jgi:hypothetical protein